MSPNDALDKSAVMTTDEVVQITHETNYGTWRFQKGWSPMHIVDAEGCYITDAKGKKYLDFSSQLMCMNLGHKNQVVIDAIKQQAQELAYAMPGYATIARAELSKLLLEVLPKGLNKFLFTTSGTDATGSRSIARWIVLARGGAGYPLPSVYGMVYKPSL